MLQFGKLYEAVRGYAPGRRKGCGDHPGQCAAAGSEGRRIARVRAGLLRRAAA